MKDRLRAVAHRLPARPRDFLYRQYHRPRLVRLRLWLRGAMLRRPGTVRARDPADHGVARDRAGSPIRRQVRDLVLVYHRVAEVQRDPFRLCVRPDRFAAHLAALVQVADVVPVAEIGCPSRSGRRRIAITFDDGYADNAEVAAPILAEHGLPATFFLTSGGLDPHSEFWWDRLEHLVLDAPGDAGSLTLELGGRTVEADVSTTPAREQTLFTLNRRLRALPPAGIAEVLGEISAAFGSWTGSCEHHRRMLPEQVRSLLAVGDVGAHTRTHPLLCALDAERARDEIAGSRADVARLARKPIHGFSYPFGVEGSFNNAIVRIVRDAGFAAAFVDVPGVVRRRTHPLLMPRLAAGTSDADALVANVERCFAGRVA